ncbi:MAG: zinc ABC transporter substrate-binding protein [Bacteroidales bacterium]|nr:zinc ABC transporter substrate-binding protein [Bacteroidales bacterium]MCF8338147.1 zinc ABC transporter substrate-binding protein [Bacteroidales bacterium]
MIKKLAILATLGFILAFTACKNTGQKSDDGKMYVVATTTMVHDLVKNIGGDRIKSDGLMGPGVDPHLYRASESDVSKLSNAEIIFYNGLHLEGKLVDVFDKMNRLGKNIYPVADTVKEDHLIPSADYASSYDPHIWFDINLWKKAAHFIADKLSKHDPENREYYQSNLKNYISEMDSVQKQINSLIDQVPKDKRILITAHDAFNYFGQAFGFEVVGLQGISTASEAGVKDVQNLADMIVKNKIGAIFIESSVPRRNIEALQEAVKSRGFDVKIGGELYSDALGTPGTEEGTYTGMFLHNVKTIVKALK